MQSSIVDKNQESCGRRHTGHQNPNRPKVTNTVKPDRRKKMCSQLSLYKNRYKFEYTPKEFTFEASGFGLLVKNQNQSVFLRTQIPNSRLAFLQLTNNLHTCK